MSTPLIFRHVADATAARGCVARTPSAGSGLAGLWRRGLLAVGLGATLVAAQAARPPAPTPTPGPATGPWFDAVSAPLAIPVSVWEKVTLEAYAALQNGRIPDDFLQIVPAEAAPRVVFLSWNNGDAPTRVVFAAGAGLREAAAAALRQAIAERSGFTPGAWLKLDVVQHAQTTPDFQARNNLLVQPSLIGIAFEHGHNFAFLPETIIGSALLTDLGVLDPEQVAARVLAEKDGRARIGNWQMVSAYPEPQVVTFFECLSFATDGNRVELLFRGHPVAKPLTLDALTAAATRGAALLARIQQPDGEFMPPWPNWLPGAPDGHELAGDQAAAILALLDTQEVTGANNATAAAKGAAYLLKKLKPFKLNAKAACLADEYHSTLAENAMAVLALVKLAKVTGKDSYPDALAKLGAYLLAQVQPDGSLVGERHHPSGNVRAPATVTASAQAILAFLRLYEHTRSTLYLDTARKSLAYLVDSELIPKEMHKLPLDGWLMLAMNDTFTYTHDTYLNREMERLVSGVELLQPRAVPFPDLLGGFDKSAAITPVAARVAGLFVAAEFLQDRRRPLAAEKTLAMAHLGLLFMLQGQVGPSASTFLPLAAACDGAFTEELLGYRFTLAGQSADLLAVTSAIGVANRMKLKALPLTKPLETALQEARTQVLTFPRCLPAHLPSLPALKDKPDEINPVETPDPPSAKPKEVKVIIPDGALVPAMPPPPKNSQKRK